MQDRRRYDKHRTGADDHSVVRKIDRAFTGKGVVEIYNLSGGIIKRKVSYWPVFQVISESRSHHMGDPCIGDKSNTTFNSQITSVIQIPGTEQYIACADRWNPQWWVKPMAKQIISGMERHFKDYKSDDSPKEVHALPGVETRHKENTAMSRYVWLPVEWEGDKPVIRWRDEWNADQF